MTGYSVIICYAAWAISDFVCAIMHQISSS